MSEFPLITDTVYNEDCCDSLLFIPDNSVDLVIGSPRRDGIKWSLDKAEKTIKLMHMAMKDGGICVWIVSDDSAKDDKSMPLFEYTVMFKEAGYNLCDTIICHKDCPCSAGGNGSEYMFVFSKGVPKTFNRRHVTFPVPLITDHILMWTNEDDLVYDPFMGVGTTAISCMKNNRRFLGSEIDTEYYDKCMKRIAEERKSVRLF